MLSIFSRINKLLLQLSDFKKKMQVSKKNQGVLHKLPTSWVILLSLLVCIMHLKNNGWKIFPFPCNMKWSYFINNSFLCTKHFTKQKRVSYVIYSSAKPYLDRQVLHSVFHQGEAVLGDEGGENPANLLYPTVTKWWI